VVLLHDEAVVGADDGIGLGNGLGGAGRVALAAVLLQRHRITVAVPCLIPALDASIA